MTRRPRDAFLVPLRATQPTIAEAEQLVKAGQEYLDKVKHPDPYIVPYYIGGSMYARNPPYPKEVSPPRRARAALRRQFARADVAHLVVVLAHRPRRADPIPSQLWQGGLRWRSGG